MAQKHGWGFAQTSCAIKIEVFEMMNCTCLHVFISKKLYGVCVG
jgi:hypothetical protein